MWLRVCSPAPTRRTASRLNSSVKDPTTFSHGTSCVGFSPTLCKCPGNRVNLKPVVPFRSQRKPDFRLFISTQDEFFVLITVKPITGGILSLYCPGLLRASLPSAELRRLVIGTKLKAVPHGFSLQRRWVVAVVSVLFVLSHSLGSDAYASTSRYCQSRLLAAEAATLTTPVRRRSNLIAMPVIASWAAGCSLCRRNLPI